jgi:hypothetical protein
VTSTVYHLRSSKDNEKTACGRTASGVEIKGRAGDFPTCKRCADSKDAIRPAEPSKDRNRKKKAPVDKKGKVGKRTRALASLKGAPKELVVTYKGTEHKATVNEDGTITVNGKSFNSPSRAGKEITGREVDGWTFWSYEVPGNGLKKLNMLRKVGE